MTIRLSLVVAGLVSLSSVALAGEQQAKVRARLCDLRAAPSSDAKSKVKLPAGRELAVLAKSDDDHWVRVKTSSPKGDEMVTFDGWLQTSDVAGADLASLSIGGKAAMANADNWSDKASSAKSDDWGGSKTETKTAKSDDSWGKSASSSSSSTPAASSGAGDWNFDDANAAPAEKKSDDSDWDKPAPSSSSSSDDSTGGW